MSSPPESRSDAWSPALVFALALAILAGFAALHEVSAPLVHDEFAYLLSADTFASGRLTNPPHPLWEHFETFHVLQQPTYQAKYPPAQGMALALGQLLGHPIVGVWLSWAAALAAVFWMLRGLVSVRWALLGACLLLFQPYLFLVWGQTYWGGALATAGGALLFGGLLRMRHRLELRDGAAIAFGLFLLGNSRPLEGIATSLLAMGLLVAYVRQRVLDEEARELVQRILIPFGLGLVVLVAWTMYYDARVTGNPFQLPYFSYHPELSPHQDIRSYTGSPEKTFLGKSYRLVTAFLGIPLAVAFPFILRKRRSRYVLYTALIVYIVSTLVVLGSRAWPHYLAPITCLVAFLALASLRGLQRWRPFGRPVGAVLFALVLTAHFGLWARDVGARIRGGPLTSWSRDRIEMTLSLEALGGKHLVLVTYGEGRERNKEWIYNRADIDAASVVWARDLGPEKNAALFDHFADRTLWRIEVPPYRPRLEPFTRDDHTAARDGD